MRLSFLNSTTSKKTTLSSVCKSHCRQNRPSFHKRKNSALRQVNGHFLLLPTVLKYSISVKVTVQNELFQKNRNSEDKRIINKQFLEYDRVIDSQSGIKKIEALEKLDRSLFIR
jgi:hypothetical protein